MRSSIIVALMALVAMLVSANTVTADQAYQRVAMNGTHKYGCKLQSIVWAAGNPAPAAYFLAMMGAESSFQEDEVSSKDAKGLLQVTQAALDHVREVYTDVTFTNDLHNPENNMKVSVYYWALLKNSGKFVGDGQVSIAYNRGPGNASKYLRRVGYDKYQADDYLTSIDYWQQFIPPVVCVASN
jgi:soluble lytic murein transglycosylase-like protein